MINEIVAAIEQAGLGMSGKTLFINMMPPTITSAVMVRPPVGGIKINHELIGMHRCQFSVIARDKILSNAESKVQQIASQLICSETQMGSIFVKYLRQDTKPYSYPLSEGNFYESQVRMSICYVE